jgi:membrane protease subunit (stomatin/prohibitin family)
MNRCLDDSWKQNYGLEITDVAIGDLNLTDESMVKVNKIDEATIFSNQALQSGLMASASADALRNASSNANGAMAGFMGLNMAAGAAGNMMGVANQNAANATTPYNPGNQTPEMGTLFGGVQAPNPAPGAETNQVVEATKEEVKAPEGKTCPNCGEVVNGKFCSNCGTKVEE